MKPLLIFIVIFSSQFYAKANICPMSPDRVSALKGKLACKESPNLNSCQDFLGIPQKNKVLSSLASSNSALGGLAGAATAEALWQAHQKNYLSNLRHYRNHFVNDYLHMYMANFLGDILPSKNIKEQRSVLDIELSKIFEMAFRSPKDQAPGNMKKIVAEEIGRVFGDLGVSANFTPEELENFSTKFITEWEMGFDKYFVERRYFHLKNGKGLTATPKVLAHRYLPRLSSRLAGIGVGATLGVGVGAVAEFMFSGSPTACPQMDGSAFPYISYSSLCAAQFSLEPKVFDFLNKDEIEQQAILNSMPEACDYYTKYYQREVDPLANLAISCRDFGKSEISGQHFDGGEYTYEVQSLFPQTGSVRQVHVFRDRKDYKVIRFDDKGDVVSSDLSGVGLDAFFELKILIPRAHNCCYENREDSQMQLTCLQSLVKDVVNENATFSSTL